MIDQRKMIDVVNENFERYAGNVILDRAICDVRDMLKPSARMLIYSQMAITKNTHKKPFIKSARVVGDCLGHLYEHGESSCYGSYMRMSKDFTMRVPLEECQGNNGTMTKNGDEAAMRYTELRLSEIASYLYDGLDKNAIGDNWRNNFDETEQYPGVMPSIGYFNLCNGTQGLGIAISSSIPQFSLREVNEAIIKLIQNPDTSDKDLIIMPDFATGGILINANEVYQALIIGQGAACKLRAVMNYNPATNSILVTELPYGVYSEVIKAQIHDLMENEQYGIKNIHDNTGKTPEIIIELNKGINARKMIEKLYKDTSLENHFTINMWVLKDGRFPQIMGLRQIFQEYIQHIRLCKRREIQFDLDKAVARKNIVDGLIKAYSIIDEVVATIRSSSNPSEAASNLISQYGFNEEQAKAILAMKLASLTKLDIVKLNNEREELVEKIEYLQHLLKDPIALDNELIKILREVADKFGDERRTKVIDLVEEEPVEDVQEEPLNIMLFSDNSIRLHSENELKGGKKGRQGTNIKPPKNASLIKTLSTTNLSSVVAFTSSGKYYSFTLSDLEKNKDYSLYELIPLQPEEKVKLLIDSTTFSFYNSLITISKRGFVKRTLVKDYNMRMKKGVAAVKLEENDDLVDVVLSQSDDDKLFICSNAGNYNFYSVAEIPITARTTRGLHGIKLKENEFVIGAALALANIEYKGIFSISTVGKGKLTSLLNFPFTSKNVKGSKIMEIKDEEVAAIAIIGNDQKELGVFANNKLVVIDLNSLGLQGRTTMGTKIIDTKNLKTKIEIALR